jgi:hypothetical protein
MLKDLAAKLASTHPLRSLPPKLWVHYSWAHHHRSFRLYSVMQVHEGVADTQGVKSCTSGGMLCLCRPKAALGCGRELHCTQLCPCPSQTAPLGGGDHPAASFASWTCKCTWAQSDSALRVDVACRKHSSLSLPQPYACQCLPACCVHDMSCLPLCHCSLHCRGGRVLSLLACLSAAQTQTIKMSRAGAACVCKPFLPMTDPHP